MLTPLLEPIRAQARAAPGRAAFRDRGAVTTYGELWDRVELRAAALAAACRPGDRVVIDGEKSVDTVVTMLACLRAALAYVPVDPRSPVARRSFVATDCAAALVVCDDARAADWAGAAVPVALATRLDAPAASPAAEHPTTRDDLAYVLYTSGSTGTPKGVRITHGNATAFVDWARATFGIRPEDRVAIHAPLHFDLPVLDLYVGLGAGATLVPVDARTAMFPRATYDLLRAERVTVLYAVPAALGALARQPGFALPDLRLLLYAGEEFPVPSLATLVRGIPAARVFNLYGPVETNVVTAFEVRAEHLGLVRVPLGRAVAGARVALYDPACGVVTAPGAEGEIVVAGPSVTPGYENRPDLTAASRLRIGGVEHYRTGDYGRWDEDGLLHFLGRRDRLVKTRGFRVELGEVEARLVRHPGVAEAAVVAVPDGDTTTLHAVVVPRRGVALAAADLLAWCGSELSPYMVPRTVAIAAALPRTSTGKIAPRELEVAP